MKTKILTSVAIMAAMMATSCDDNWTPPVGDDGQLDLSSVTVVNDDAAKLIKSEQSRADVDVTAYLVEICAAGETTPVNSWTYGSMPEIVTLNQGDYTINVESHKVEKAAWEAPYYKGSKSFKIEAGKITQVEPVECKFASVKVTIEVADDLKEAFADDLTFTVKVNDEGQLVYGKNETRAGYFEAVNDSPTMVIDVKGTLSGNAFEKNYTFKDIAAGQWRQIVFKTAEAPVPPQPSGDVEAGGITIDVSYTDRDVDGNVKYEEEIIDSSNRPGKEDPKDPTPENPDDPTPPVTDEPVKFSSDYLDLEGVNDAANFGEEPGQKPAVVVITTREPMTSLEVTIDSGTLTSEVLDGVGLATNFNLASPGVFEEGLMGLGLPVGDQVVGKTEVTFDITKFMSLLGIYGAANHNFILKVVDQSANENTLILRFVTK